MTAAQPHVPVMIEEVLSALSPRSGEVYVDATFGAGGYTKAILDAADCTVIAIDRDIHAQQIATRLKEEYGDRLVFVHGKFSDINDILQGLDLSSVDGLVLDIGVSSMQLDQAERGFSFQKDGPLDMRMDTGAGQSAADLIADSRVEDLARIIYEYGEERHSRRIARAIERRREGEEIATTSMLADIVRAAVPGKSKPGVDKATKTFQALRIAVNDELKELSEVLEASRLVLNEGGRLVVVSFHSLEDRIVKQFLRRYSGEKKGVSRHLPDIERESDAEFELLSRKALLPGAEEINRNPRARSAKLRAARRVSKGGEA